MKKFKKIRVLIWDFDGTLYKPNPALFQAVRQAEYRTIIDHTGWQKEHVEEEFKKLHTIVYPSATVVTAVLCKISISRAAREMEKYFDRRDFLKRDEKLIALFRKLRDFRHFTLANGTISRHKETLAVLGLPVEMFEEMVTSEVVGVTKPHLDGFRYILTKTGLPASEHLMIGDRESIDLVPAKKLGMKTCLVWSKKRSSIADITLPTVYELDQILV